MKSDLGLNVLLEDSLDALQRKSGFKLSGFKLQVCSVSEKGLGRVNASILSSCKECLSNNRDNSTICSDPSELSLHFLGLPATPRVQTFAVPDDARSLRPHSKDFSDVLRRLVCTIKAIGS
jgi:hypothetical protein